MSPEVVVDGIRWAHALAWLPGEQALAAGSMADGVIFRIDPDRCTKELWARTRGGPNGAVVASDGGLLVAQNGGVDLTELYPDADPRGAPVGLQRVRPGGRVDTVVAGDALHGPAGLAVAADGRVLVADPPRWPPPEDPAEGRIWVLDPDAAFASHITGLWCPTAVAFDASGELVFLDGHALVRRNPDASLETLVRQVAPMPCLDLAVDDAGRVYVATGADGAVRVVDGGAVVTVLAGDPGAVITNCCLGGPGGRTLFATDARHDRVLVWESMPSPGLPLDPWHVPAPTDRELEETSAEARAAAELGDP